MPRVWCAAIECEHNKENQCTAAEINLSTAHVHTVHQGFMEYWKCRTFTESEESAALRRFFDGAIMQMDKDRALHRIAHPPHVATVPYEAYSALEDKYKKLMETCGILDTALREYQQKYGE